MSGYNLRSKRQTIKQSLPYPTTKPKAVKKISVKKVVVLEPQITMKKVVALKLPNVNFCTTNILLSSSWGSNQYQQRSHEDRYQARYFPAITFRFFAIYDGHAGSFEMNNEHVADYCYNHLHEDLYMKLQSINVNDVESVTSTIKTFFVDFDRKMYDLKLKYGSTCTMILIDDNNHRIYQVNLGDSRSIVFTSDQQQDTIISETKDHSPDDVEEFDRIKAAGSFVLRGRVDGNLMISRSFGDFALKTNLTKNIDYDPISGPVSAVPSVQVVNIDMNQSTGIILTSDAPFDNKSFSNQDLVNLYTTYAKISESLNITALKMVKLISLKTTDDVTIVLVRV